MYVVKAIETTCLYLRKKYFLFERKRSHFDNFFHMTIIQSNVEHEIIFFFLNL